ncbi:hypothetical protein L211DRAFT_883103 [Terfezia boudieri ATCC MYA-4762]|uniref:Uncharacterized protein n=1 Tax=Terfezia boudieri ATCC MYA-4762 TaxID=1051890 RepID=A0A3N4LKD3_9PEZI|nr:hypothetical protein L211DRAFT_883103 [Terfezia boudieri ATCC MYA-4762]
MASSNLQPPSSQVPSKRDKRRNLLSDRLTELSVSFERDRDIHFRNQLAALQQDLGAISRVDTSGRNRRLLDDSAEGIDHFVTRGSWVGDRAAMSNFRGSGGPGGAMGGVQPGAFYAGFVAEVNEKMEERDVALTLLHKQYHAKVAAIKTQHERSLHHAREEHINLAVTMKQRLINRLYNAKKKLSLDKEHLDISDSNALLLHPNQFSLGSAAAGVLGSPSRNDIDRGSDIFGGGTINGSNGGGRRKLRQRRNELDDLMMMGPGGIFDNFGRKDSDNGDAKSAAAQRRKARAARYNRRINAMVGEDEENTMEDIYGNVHTNGGTDGDGNNSGNNSAVGHQQLNILLPATQNQTKTQTVGNGHAAAVQQVQAQELLHKQVFSIEKLFTEKELQMAGNLAALATVKFFSKPKERGSRKSKKRNVGGEDGAEAGTNEESDAGVKTPREDAESKEDVDKATTMASFTTATGDDQAKTHGKDSASISSSPDLSTITPAALFSSVIASSANHIRSTNPSLLPTHATPLINPTALNSHPPPSITALNFMTPTSSGYGAQVWQSLGVQASYFSAGSGLIINNITTAKMMALSAPCPGAARNEEAMEDLEMIKSGRGLVEEEEEEEEEEGTGEDEVEEERSREPVQGRKGRKGREEKEREREREREQEKEKEKEGSPSPSPRGEGKKVVGLGLGLGLNIDEQDDEEPEAEDKEKEKEKDHFAPPPLAASELAHGVKRRSSSGPGGAEKRARKEKDGRRQKEREKGREKERERAREMMDDDVAGEEGDAEEES